MNPLKNLLCIIFGFSSGIVIAGAVFAFIAIIGIVPRLAQKTGTTKNIKLYEEAIITGGILGTLASIFKPMLFNPATAFGVAASVIIALLSGIFYGCLAVSLAEILDVIPILTRRIGIKRGLPLFIITLAVGKLIGSLGYFIIPGFKK